MYQISILSICFSISYYMRQFGVTLEGVGNCFKKGSTGLGYIRVRAVFKGKSGFIKHLFQFVISKHMHFISDFNPKYMF